MAVYFADTSALARRHVAEIGSAWIQGLLDPAAGNVIIIARITAAELIAALTRRERGGSITPGEDAATARADFRAHLSAKYQVVEVDEAVVNTAMFLAETHGLRGYDAVQLAAASIVNTRYLSAGLPPIVILSSDGELNAAAVADGLLVDDPGAHP